MRRRILVADDEESITRIVVRILEDAGYECLLAHDGPEALKVFRERSPDALVLDLNLPGLHGLEVLRTVKELRSDVVVVILTGHSNEQTAIRALKLGADDYLQKPVRASVLTDSLRRGLDRAETERRAASGEAAWACVADDRLSGAFFEAPSPLLYADSHGCIAAVNQAAARLLGQSASSLLGQRVDGFVVPALRNAWLDTVRRDTREGRAYEAEILLRGAATESMPVSVSAASDPAHEGCLVFSLRDLTQQKALELHYFETKKLASLGRVVEGVAHEVRNPLVSVGGFARKLLEEVEGNGRGRRYLEVILSDVLRLERMVQEIEGYVEFMNRRRPGFSPIDVGGVLTRAIERTAGRFQAQGVLVRWSEPEGLPTIYGDGALLSDLFDGLVENAFEAMPGGGELAAGCEVEGNWARVRIADTGVGIPQEDLTEVFNPFFTSKTSGAGLGLAKAYMIVEEHSGTIEFESTPGRGTVCHVGLPVDRRRLRRAHA